MFTTIFIAAFLVYGYKIARKQGSVPPITKWFSEERK